MLRNAHVIVAGTAVGLLLAVTRNLPWQYVVLGILAPSCGFALGAFIAIRCRLAFLKVYAVSDEDRADDKRLR